MAEIIKYGVIKDPKLFRFLETGCLKVLKLDRGALEYVIATSSRIKAAVVAKDEFDRTGARVILNYGHTIGHAIEAASGYSDRFSHGEAVAIGMAAASRISEALGILKKTDADRIEALLKRTGLPVKAEGLKPAAMYGAHLHDKKFVRGTNRFVLPVKIGMVRVVEGVPERIVKSAIRELVR
jgi:3-dehydroquinate synthase